jgi:ribosomal protein S3AE
MDEIVELKNLEVKKLFLTQQRLEEETGKSIHDILFEIIYGKAPSLALEAIKVIYEVIFFSSLTMEEIEEDPELAEIIPFGNRESLQGGEE